jgi:hypothetical protein
MDACPPASRAMSRTGEDYLADLHIMGDVEDVEGTVNVRRQQVLSSREPRKVRSPARWMAVSMSSIAPNSESRSVVSRFRTSSPGRR